MLKSSNKAVAESDAFFVPLELVATDANLHELRKRVKDLWYDLRLLGGGRSPPIEALTKRVRDLGQKLGDDHDVAMLLAARADSAARTRGLEDARKSNRLSSSAIAARRASARVEGPHSQTESIWRFRRRSLGNLALSSQDKVTRSC
jgi:CHAD domain-containing protein